MTEAFRESVSRIIGKTFGGEHHVRSVEFAPCGDEREYAVVKLGSGHTMSTWDNGELTALVIGAHEECIRVEVEPNGMRGLKILMHPRKRQTERQLPIMECHPTIEQSVRGYRDGSEWARIRQELSI